MAIARVDVLKWLLRVIAWDGMLPAAVMLGPSLVEWLFPNNRKGVEVVAILLPITAFIVRYGVGKRSIGANHCADIVRILQFWVFVIGICVLVLGESMVIIALHLVANPAIVFDETGSIVFGVLLSIYFVSMIIAMYPGAIPEKAEPSF